MVPMDSEAKPSEVTDVFWIYARREKGTYHKSSERNGKWLIFVPSQNIDGKWAKIRKATEEGLLGSSSKVSTARPNPNSTEPNKHVICVYTYDWADEKDVRQIREQLRELGVTEKIPYKADSDTAAGKYRAKGDQRISKYYE